jgi:hypothetical protein
MTAHELKNLVLVSTTPNENNDEYNIPLDITDIISICREFNKLGWQIQSQVENILEIGVEESIKTGKVKQSSLHHIKSFFKAVHNNPYFGDSSLQSQDIIYQIDNFLIKNETDKLN